MLRIYPKGMRFDSSNYNPLIGWSHGAQMVAFNMQVSNVDTEEVKDGEFLTDILDCHDLSSSNLVCT